MIHFLLERAPGISFANARAQAMEAERAGYPPAPVDEREWETIGFYLTMGDAHKQMQESFERGHPVIHRVIVLDTKSLH